MTAAIDPLPVLGVVTQPIYLVCAIGVLDRVAAFARLMNSPVGAELAEKANRALTATVVEVGRRGTSTLLENEDWAALHESAIQARAERDRPVPTDH